MNKEKVLKYLNSRIEAFEKENEYDRSLDDKFIGKQQFIERSSTALRVLKEVKAMVEVGQLD